MFCRSCLAPLALAIAALITLPAQAASKKGGKAAPADPAMQSKAVSIFLSLISEYYCAGEGPGISAPTYQFDEASKKYVLKETKMTPCTADAMPEVVTAGATTVATLLSSLETNYDTATEANVARNFPIYLQGADAAGEKVFGHTFIEKRLEEKSGGTFVMYSPTAFENAFTMLYAKPSETRGGVVLQKLYDALFKAAVVQQTETIVKVLNKRKEFEAKAKELLKRAETDQSFYGGEFGYQVAAELNGGSIKNGEASGEPLIDPSLMGSLLRRQADGTLPVFLRSLKTVLKDYDPDAFKKFGAKL